MTASASVEDFRPTDDESLSAPSDGKFQQCLDRALELIRDDLCEWLSQLLELSVPIDPVNYLDYLENGVLLCRLMQKMQSAAGQAVRRFHSLARPGSFPARDNISVFLAWCRSDQHLDDVLLFETSGLVERREERNLVLTLLQLARICPNLGLPAPQIVRLEREIDGLSSMANSSTCSDSVAAASTATPNQTSEFSSASSASEDGDNIYRTQRSSSLDDFCDGDSGSVSENCADGNNPTDTTVTNVSSAVSAEPTNAAKSNSSAKITNSGSQQQRKQPLQQKQQQQQQLKLNSKQQQQKHNLQAKPQRPSSAGIQRQQQRRPSVVADQHLTSSPGRQKSAEQKQKQQQQQQQQQKQQKLAVRIFRNTKMVRVGGGWVTLDDYLKYHEPDRLALVTEGLNTYSVAQGKVRYKTAQHAQNQ